MPGKHASTVANPFGVRVPLAVWRTAWTGLIVLLSVATVVAWVTWLRPAPPDGRRDPQLVLPPPVPPVLPSGSAPVSILPAPSGAPSLPAPTAATARPSATATTPPLARPTPTSARTSGGPLAVAVPPPLPSPETEVTVLPVAPPESTPATEARVTAGYRLVSTWSGGFVSNVKITNPAGTPSTWTVSLKFADSAGVDVVQYWNARIDQDGDTKVFSGGPLAPGASVTFGFNASKDTTSKVNPTA